ncbi:zinc metallopeptidase [Ahrensia marina]|uniref:Peptidase n=1 Tax=Ahrensia marina TaxID=1514904 RepID=A0A0N0E8Z3_9HYPH|nr:zinc metallopeptidase [Ahrensia marina]KPB02931.1 peptidase [Ahrensia marina]
MVLIAGIGFLLVLAAVYAPQYWVRHTMEKHSQPRPDFPGTGGELARHLLETFKIEGVGVEETDSGDHYDPENRVVRLSANNFHEPSLTAVAVAAHEVGHAIQHHRDERGLKTRHMLVSVAMVTDKIAGIFFLAAPVLFVIVRSPAAIYAMIALGIMLLAVRVLVHFFTLPVEYDASFNKALPILKEGGYLQENDLAAARSVLKAAALTYVAGALMSLLNLARWIRLLR